MLPLNETTSCNTKLRPSRRSALGSVSNKDETCKTQKTVVSEAGARAKLTFAREESNNNTVPLSQQTATFIS